MQDLRCYSVSVMTCHWALVLVRRVGLKHKNQCALQLQTINMGLDKVSRALLVKLFYQNNNNSAASLREYQRIIGILLRLCSADLFSNKGVNIIMLVK